MFSKENQCQKNWSDFICTIKLVYFAFYHSHHSQMMFALNSQQNFSSIKSTIFLCNQNKWLTFFYSFEQFFRPQNISKPLWKCMIVRACSSSQPVCQTKKSLSLSHTNTHNSLYKFKINYERGCCKFSSLLLYLYNKFRVRFGKMRRF